MSPEITLEPEQPDDDGFLFELYLTTRADEMALTPWNDEQRRAFLRQQYELRGRHYRGYYSGAEYLLIRRGGYAIGRIAIDRSEDEIRIVDIALVPEHRGRGIGSQLIHELLVEASLRKIPVTLHVERHNRAAGPLPAARLSCNRRQRSLFIFEVGPGEPLTTITQYNDNSEISCNISCLWQRPGSAYCHSSRGQPSAPRSQLPSDLSTSRTRRFVGSAVFGTALTGQPAPFDAIIGSDIGGPNFSGTWTFHYVACRGREHYERLHRDWCVGR